MKRAVGLFLPCKFILSFFAVDYLALARYYLIVPNRVHRFFTIAIAAACVIFTGLFLAYAIVEKYKMTDNFLFGQVKFSFVDRGYPEILGYFLEFICILVFTLHALLHKRKYWFAWAAIFVIVLLDDAIGVHEVLGNLLLGEETLSPVMDGLAVFAIMGLMFAVLWLAGLLTMHDESEFPVYMLLSIYFAVLVVIGVGVDGIHAQLKNYFSIPDTLLTLAEDGLELFLIAIMTITAIGIWYRSPQ